MKNIKDKIRRRLRRHTHIRRRVIGTAGRPRVSVHRSHANMYVQITDDQQGHTLVGMSTLSAGIRSTLAYGGNVQAAGLLGEKLAERAKTLGITKVVFDRGGYKYTGRVRALAQALRQRGLEF